MSNQDTYNNDPHMGATPDQGASQTHQSATDPSLDNSVPQQSSVPGAEAIPYPNILTILAIRFPALEMTKRLAIAAKHELYMSLAQKLEVEAIEMGNSLGPTSDGDSTASGSPLQLAIELPKSRASVSILWRAMTLCITKAIILEKNSIEDIDWFVEHDECEDIIFKQIYDNSPEIQQGLEVRSPDLTIFERLVRLKSILLPIIRPAQAPADMEELDAAFAGVRIGGAEDLARSIRAEDPAQTIAGLMGGLSL